MIDIVCLKWGDLYDYHYVNRLYAGLKRYLSHEFKMHCITDNKWRIDPEINIVDLPVTIPKWWGKAKAFDKELFPGRTLVFDLDTVIVGNIDFLAEYDGDFAALQGFGMPFRLGSAVMSIGPGKYGEIWTEYSKDPQFAQMFCGSWGDGHWMQLHTGEFDRLQLMHPGKFVSFKWPLRGNKWFCEDGPPEDAAVVAFHGSPRPHEIDSPWMKEKWYGQDTSEESARESSAA